jgi:selenium metabolism protein YedF
MKELDLRGRPCPQPVVETRKALATNDALVALVDNPASAENVKRMATSMGCSVDIQQQGESLIHLTIQKGAGETCQTCETQPWVAVLISSDRFGEGDDELGRKLMKGFIKTLPELDQRPECVIFVNAGVHFVVTGSEVLEALKGLEKNGVQILACGTCLDHFRIKDQVAVGNVSNMLEIASTLASADRVVRP